LPAQLLLHEARDVRSPGRDLTGNSNDWHEI
jgi:hypothetical protein